MARKEHSFQFHASQIAEAAKREAEYHEDRATYWAGEMETAYDVVERTMGVKIVKQQHTGGWSPSVTVDYGDPAAYSRMQGAGAKVQSHQKAAEQFRTDEKLYGTQGDRVYDLDVTDVHYYRLGGGSREE